MFFQSISSSLRILLQVFLVWLRCDLWDKKSCWHKRGPSWHFFNKLPCAQDQSVTRKCRGLEITNKGPKSVRESWRIHHRQTQVSSSAATSLLILNRKIKQADQSFPPIKLCLCFMSADWKFVQVVLNSCSSDMKTITRIITKNSSSWLFDHTRFTTQTCYIFLNLFSPSAKHFMNDLNSFTKLLQNKWIVLINTITYAIVPVRRVSTIRDSCLNLNWVKKQLHGG